jgi:FeS assembly SUF system protein
MMSEQLIKPSPEEIKEDIIEMLKTIYDPEIPVNIYELGLIYEVEFEDETGKVDIKMTLTAPGCPVAQSFPGDVESKVNMVTGVSESHVELVWDPPWTKDLMSEAAQLQLGMF